MKDNRPKVPEAIGAVVEEHPGGASEGLEHRNYETDGHGRGRRDERFYFVPRVPSDSAAKGEWPWTKAIGTAVRITTHADGSRSDEVRYYALSRFVSGKRLGAAVRRQRGIGSMHRALDVTLRGDESRTRERTPANNWSGLRRFAVTLLKRHPIEDGIRGEMSRRPTSTQFLDEVLTLQEVRYALAVGGRSTVHGELHTYVHRGRLAGPMEAERGHRPTSEKDACADGEDQLTRKAAHG